jgi:Cation transporter/ATPase, N-terminus
MTTCPVVCVANVSDCPTSCQRISGIVNATLCTSGSCKETCAEYSDDTNPCTCELLPVACPKVVGYYDECLVSFQDFYDSNTECLSSQSESIAMISFTGPYFLFFYVWICCVTLLVVGWCYFNEVLFPDHGRTTRPFWRSKPSASKKTTSEASSQTGYKQSLIGSGIYGLVITTSIGFQVLLIVTTIFYYMQQGAITRWPLVFEDESQSLQAFVMTWMIGLPWTISFRYVQAGAHTLFFRRCALSEATYVAVLSPIEGFGTRDRWVDHLARLIWIPIDRMLSTVFSYPYSATGWEVMFCKVEKDSRTESRGIYFHMRRFVFDKSRDSFQPVNVPVGKTLGDFLSKAAGLSTKEAARRRRIVGPNRMNVDRPTVLSSLCKEFSKTF